MKTPYILTDAGRFSDLMKQGFMKPHKAPRLRGDGKAVGAPKPIVACRACENWHREGNHTLLDAAERRANVKKYRERDKADAARRALYGCEPV